MPSRLNNQVVAFESGASGPANSGDIRDMGSILGS